MTFIAGDEGKMRFMFMEVMHAKESMNFSVIDALLETTKMDESSIVLVAYLRGPCTIKQHLKHWDSFFIKVECELDRRGEDSKHSLRGLYKYFRFEVK